MRIRRRAAWKNLFESNLVILDVSEGEGEQNDQQEESNSQSDATICEKWEWEENEARKITYRRKTKRV